MRVVENLSNTKKLDLEQLKDFIDDTYIQKGTLGVFMFNSKAAFPTIGSEDCLYIDKSDGYKSYVWDSECNEYKDTDDFDTIQG